MVILIVLTLLVPLWIFRRVAPDAAEDRTPGIRLIGPISIALTLSIVVLQVVNVVFIRDLWPMVAGLLATMALSLFSFGYILFAPSRVELQS